MEAAVETAVEAAVETAVGAAVKTAVEARLVAGLVSGGMKSVVLSLLFFTSLHFISLFLSDFFRIFSERIFFASFLFFA